MTSGFGWFDWDRYQIGFIRPRMTVNSAQRKERVKFGQRNMKANLWAFRKPANDMLPEVH